jgi:hypothetical protein
MQPSFNFNGHAAQEHAYALYDGNSKKPLAIVVEDEDGWHQIMFVIVWPDGEQSDIANLSRAKDAAEVIAERGPPPRNRQRFHWKLGCRLPLRQGGRS